MDRRPNMIWYYMIFFITLEKKTYQILTLDCFEQVIFLL